MKRFPASIPRRQFWSDSVGKEVCPQCGEILANERHTYLVSVKDDGDFDEFVMGTDAGHFCPACPTIVLDNEKFIKLLELGTELTGECKFAVLGIVDLDAVPEDKRNIPLGAEGNPIPLVEFINATRKSPRERAKERAKKRRKPKKRR